MRNCIYFVLICAMMLSVTLQAQTSEERLQKLEKLCEQQELQIQKLQDRLGVMQDDSSYKKYTENIVREYLKEPAVEDDGTGITAGYDNGFFVRAAEGNVELKLTGYLQAGLGIMENDTDANNSFYLNGVYLNFDMFLLKDWHARIQIDFASPSARFYNGGYSTALRDAYIEYIGIKEFGIRVGQTHVPFSMQGQYGETEGMTIWSEPFIKGWSHGRDLGAMLHGIIGDRLGYQAGLFNGSGMNNSNRDDDFLMAAQLRFYYCGAAANPNNFIHVGFLRNREENRSNAGGNGNVALSTSYDRLLFPGGLFSEDGVTQGWRNAADVAFRFDRDMDGGHNVRVESEFMYSTWQRDYDNTYTTGRRSWIEGFGWTFGFTYRHCIKPEIKGSGIVAGFVFSYTDLDNKDTRAALDPANNDNIAGQRVYAYTFILGYNFNKHISVGFNWVVLDVDNKVYYGTSKSISNVPARSGGLEHAWFFQITSQF